MSLQDEKVQNKRRADMCIKEKYERAEQRRGAVVGGRSALTKKGTWIRGR